MVAQPLGNANVLALAQELLEEPRRAVAAIAGIGEIADRVLVGLRLGVATVAEVAEVGAELKEYAKKQKGNNYVKDKRKIV